MEPDLLSLIEHADNAIAESQRLMEVADRRLEVAVVGTRQDQIRRSALRETARIQSSCKAVKLLDALESLPVFDLEQNVLPQLSSM
jgi:hypothetical protein